MLKRIVSVAPMQGWTDRHCRYFHRLLSKNTLLYTEMIAAAAILQGDRNVLLAYDPFEHPVALQLGGHIPEELAVAARVGEEYGYDEINLNLGCPSERVHAGRFGACLMQDPACVADCVAAMCEAVAIPVTVKIRIGVDAQDEYEDFARFVSTVVDAGCKVFIVHARKAVLGKLSPRQNREIPPLRYDWVFRLKQEYPDLTVVLNGGLKTMTDIERVMPEVDGVMIGRAAYHDPYLLAQMDRRFYDVNAPIPTREEIIQQWLPYLESQLAQGVRLHQMTRHILGLYTGQPGARAWRRHLSEQGLKDGADIQVLLEALAWVEAG